MQELNDIALLREYADHESEEAFAALVTRHVNKVYSVALRHTRNPHQAEEITQAVFAILARKARHLGKAVILSGWLYQTARLTAVTFIRSEVRRAHREQEAHMQTLLNENESGVWPQIAPLLDTAMDRLGEVDRHAVVLRFFDGKSMKEVGSALGVSEDAAKMRLNRAVEKLRGFFTKRGVTLPAAALTASISANSVQAAPALLAKTATAVAFAEGATASASTLTLINGALKLMAWTQAKTAIYMSVGALVVAGAAAVTIASIRHEQEPPAMAAVPEVAPITQADNPSPPASPLEQIALAPVPAEPQAPPVVKVAAAVPQSPPTPLIYPTAPRISEVIAAQQTSMGATGGLASASAEMNLQFQYGNLFQKLNLTTDQIEAFMKIMKDKQAGTSAIMREHPLDFNSLAGLTSAQATAAYEQHQQQVQGLLQPVEQYADLQIRQLLGSDEYFNYYRTYIDQQKERAVVMGGYREGLASAGVAPLTLDQAEQLVNGIYQSRLAAGGDSEIQVRQIPDTLQQAGTFLTPDQLQALMKYTRTLVAPPVSGWGAVGGSNFRSQAPAAAGN